MKKITVTSNNQLRMTDIAGNLKFRCAIGRSGMIDAAKKREGDGASPIGVWRLKQVFYRPDRLNEPETDLPVRALGQQMGWCDAPDDPNYNQLITRPYAASHEALWRDDHVYDIIVELAHNDAPVVPYLGSAVFLHVARPDYKATQGCAALALDDLRTVLAKATPETYLEFRL